MELSMSWEVRKWSSQGRGEPRKVPQETDAVGNGQQVEWQQELRHMEAASDAAALTGSGAEQGFQKGQLGSAALLPLLSSYLDSLSSASCLCGL